MKQETGVRDLDQGIPLIFWVRTGLVCLANTRPLSFNSAKDELSAAVLVFSPSHHFLIFFRKPSAARRVAPYWTFESSRLGSSIKSHPCVPADLSILSRSPAISLSLSRNTGLLLHSQGFQACKLRTKHCDLVPSPHIKVTYVVQDGSHR